MSDGSACQGLSGPVDDKSFHDVVICRTGKALRIAIFHYHNRAGSYYSVELAPLERSVR
jgi:hypothetical protein